SNSPFALVAVLLTDLSAQVAVTGRAGEPVEVFNPNQVGGLGAVDLNAFSLARGVVARLGEKLIAFVLGGGEAEDAAEAEPKQQAGESGPGAPTLQQFILGLKKALERLERPDGEEGDLPGEDQAAATKPAWPGSFSPLWRLAADAVCRLLAATGVEASPGTE